MNSTLEVKNLSYTLNKKKLLKNISFSLNENEKLVLLGHNGSGKSLLIDCILGNLTFDGNVENQVKDKNKLGVLYDRFAGLPLLKVNELLSLLEVIYASPRDHELTRKLNLSAINHKYFTVLSKGERKKVGLYAALFFRPKFLILDEPTDGLDPEFRDFFWDFLKNTDVTLLLTTHLWEEAKKIADKIIFIDNGNLLNQPKSYNELLREMALEGKVIIENNKKLSWLNNFFNFSIEQKVYIYYKNKQEKDRLLNNIYKENLSGYSILNLNIKDVYYHLKSNRK